MTAYRSELSSLSLKDVCICSQIKSQMLTYSMAQECHPADIPKCVLMGEILSEQTSDWYGLHVLT